MSTIMVVDDSSVIRKTLVQKLENLGHEVVAQASSGRSAVELYEVHNPDLVTMDITMPDMNGIEALKEIRSKSKSAKIVMVTSHGEEKQVMEAITNGAKGYILKPITVAKIEEVISKIFPT